MHKLWAKHRDNVEFVVVYIREAHPEDGWVITSNREQGIAFNDPTSNDKRGPWGFDPQKLSDAIESL